MEVVYLGFQKVLCMMPFKGILKVQRIEDIKPWTWSIGKNRAGKIRLFFSCGTVSGQVPSKLAVDP